MGEGTNLRLALHGLGTNLHGNLNWTSEDDALLAFLLSMESFDLVHHRLEEADDSWLASGYLCPNGWKELVLAEGEFRELKISLEEQCWKVSVVDKVGHERFELVLILSAPNLEVQYEMSTEHVHKKPIMHVDRCIESLAVVVEESRILRLRKIFGKLLKMSDELQASTKRQRRDCIRRRGLLDLRGFIGVFR